MLLDSDDSADDGVSLAGGIFALVAQAAAVWRPEVAAEIDLLEKFIRGAFVHSLIERHGIDPLIAVNYADSLCRQIRTSLADAFTARRDVLTE